MARRATSTESPNSNIFGNRFCVEGADTGVRSIFKLLSRSLRLSCSSGVLGFTAIPIVFHLFLSKVQRLEVLTTVFYEARRASTILNREARIDGSSDPRKPIPAPKIKADSIKSGVTRKLNAISLKFVKFAVPVETKF